MLRCSFRHRIRLLLGNPWPLAIEFLILSQALAGPARCSQSRNANSYEPLSVAQSLIKMIQIDTNAQLFECCMVGMSRESKLSATRC